MNKKLFAIPISLGAAALVCAKTVFLIAPGKSSYAQKAPFLGRNFAHRGLYGEDQNPPENSLAAFSKAVSLGYGVELDLRLSLDGQLAVIHDDELSRMTGAEGRVSETEYDELKKLTLADSDEKIPLFGEVLALLNGRVPIIIELKRGSYGKEICRRLVQELEGYSGPVCVESFDPMIVAWFKNNAPKLLRGQLVKSAKQFRGAGVNTVAAAAISRGLTNFLSRPQFIAHSMGKRTWLMKLSRSLGAMRVAYTARDESAEKRNDAVIFEHFRPRVWFK
jgi:glycerophosphoryl diester phosphodiesterase